MTPTTQQLNVIAAAVRESMLKVEACAGGGKTSTLVLVANEIQEKSIYVAFNKVTAEEAAERFPSWVTSQTTHSLAFRAFGVALMQKLNRPKGGYVNVAGTGSEIALFYRIEGVEGVATPAALGAFVKSAVERFQQSADMELTKKHVPTKGMEKLLETNPELVGLVLKYAKMLWKDRCDTYKVVMATHDTYLKLYQMSKPVLPYDVVYADEFQDTSPCVLDIILNQEHAKIIMVGDRRQAIYGWRGAVNAMQSVKCVEAPLSMSFRYGQGIADVATHILKGDMKIQGRPDLASTIGFGVVDRTKPHAVLFRTNAALLSEAVQAIDKGQKIKVEIDVKDFVKVLESAQALYEAHKEYSAPAIKAAMKKVKHERILPYNSWPKLVEEASEQGGEMKRLAAIVEGGDAEHIISVLERYQAPPNAAVVYTSAHKSKGREWRQVILADDFPSHYKKGEYVGLSEAEENLLYVAATRSQSVLEINRSVQEALNLAKYGCAGVVESCADLDKAFRKERREVDAIIHG